MVGKLLFGGEPWNIKLESYKKWVWKERPGDDTDDTETICLQSLWGIV